MKLYSYLYLMIAAMMPYCSTPAPAEPETFESAPPAIKRATGLIIKKGWSKNVKFRSALTAVTLPRHFDWREQGVLVSSRDQGDCGSCWAYSTVSVL